MRTKFLASAVCLAAAVLVGFPVLAAESGDEKPKYKTKVIMKEAFKGPLLKKVAGGEASADDAKKLHEMLVALAANQPHKGDDESWKTLTVALVKAGEAAVEGKPEAGEMLKKASNCKACHSKHK